MSCLVLWRRLSETDFNAINGDASPYGRGGGAMHIALGVRTDEFPIDDFLNAPGRVEITISAASNSPRLRVAPLSFSGNPKRRGGEWRIRDQYSHRHPAWTESSGFPSDYDHTNPPYVLVFRSGEAFHARFILRSRLAKLRDSVRPRGMLAKSTGIATAPAGFCAVMGVPEPTILEEFKAREQEEPTDEFYPKSIADGRERIVAAIIRRLGQRVFRRKLISAYSARCAITQCTSLWVLEAAHITPYRGIRTNAVSNGLLLRADIHTLFDLGLISIEPTRLTIRVSSLLDGSEYEGLDGKRPALPTKPALRPNLAAIEEHYRLFNS